MDDDYGYANARLRAMKSRLLTRDDYAELLGESGLEDMIARLTHTVYQRAVEAALIRASGWDCLSEALRRHFAQTLTQVSGFFSGNAKRLWELLIERWEVFNLKTILRGQAHHVRTDQVLGALLPAGELQASDHLRLVQQTSIRAVVDLLATWRHPYAEPLLAAMPRYSARGELAELELALDRARYASGLKQAAEIGDENAEKVRRVLRNEIDALNIMIVLRLSEGLGSGSWLMERYGAAAPAALLVEGGGTPTEKLLGYKELPSIERTVDDLSETPLGGALAEGLRKYPKNRRLSAFEDEIDANLTRENLAFFHRDPLSIGIAIAYLTALVREIRRLRVIGRGKDAGWKREEIETELRLWQN